MQKLSKYLIPLSFFISPLTILSFPDNRDLIVAFTEFGVELWLVFELILFTFRSQKFKSIDGTIFLIFASIICVFISDTLNSARIIKITDNYALLSDCLYSGFAFFLLAFLAAKLNIKNRRFKEWGWLFLAALIIDGYVSYYFLLAPYYHTNASIAWKISGSIYMVLTILIFALIFPFGFRVSDRRTFWFLNMIFLLLASDFAIRYQDAFIDTTKFSWAEIGWSSTILGLAWLTRLSLNKNELFVAQPLVLAPFISIRSLLTLLICSANNLLLIGILSFKIYSVETAIDITSVFLLIFLFWTIANEFSIWLASDLSYTLEHMFKSKEHVAPDGMVQFNLEPVTAKNHIFEIAKILESYNDLAEQTNKIMDIVIETNKKATMAEVAFQVSHDIRSPLAALDMSVRSLPDLPEENRILIRSSLGRIKDITNNLLQKNPKLAPKEIAQLNTKTSDETKSIQLLSSLIDRLISEKRMQFRTKIRVEIDSALDENAYGIFSEINTREFMRLLSNLINNAVEAIKDSGRVTISLNQFENYAVISIIDNGCGMTSDMLNSLGQRGNSFGKEYGSGLGLYHAFKTVESWNGHIKIDSTPDIGSTISIFLPLAKAASWFVEHLHISAHSKVVVLDDDASIHKIWNGRFEKLNASNSGIQILHFSTPEQLILWTKENENILTQTVFLIDYEFLGFEQVGLDIIEDLGIQPQSILITSHYEEIELRSRCEKLSVQLIPKDMAGFVPITIDNDPRPDAILIDDDFLIHSSWKLSANEKNKTLAAFSSAEEFFRVAKKYAKNIPIYVDVSLANGIRGEDVALTLFEFGYSNIFLETGYEAASFGNLPFIKGITDKYPPF